MKILVTGGNGFIGKALAEYLVSLNHDVSVICSTSSNVPCGVSQVYYTSISGVPIDDILHDTEIVIHLMAHNDTLCKNYQEIKRINVHNSIHLLSRSIKHKCKKFIYASTTAVYGNSPIPFHEQTAFNPLNGYAKSKLELDEIIKCNFGYQRNIEIACLRFCNVYGPGELRKERRMSFIGKAILNVIRDMPVYLFKWGEQKRDWLYIKDAIQAICLAMTFSQKNAFEIFNIGSGSSITFNDLVRIIYEIAGKITDCKIIYTDCPFREQYQSNTQCNIEKARTEMNFCPGYDIYQGIDEYMSNLSNGQTWPIQLPSAFHSSSFSLRS